MFTGVGAEIGGAGGGVHSSAARKAVLVAETQRLGGEIPGTRTSGAVWGRESRRRKDLLRGSGCRCLRS